MRIVTAAVLLLFAMQVRAAETGYAVRATEIRQAPFSDAASVATLPEKSKVTIMARQGGWLKIRDGGGVTGWVRMLSLRLGEAEPQRGDSGLKSLFNLARSGSSGTTVTTGVRGLSEEDLKKAQPNPQELHKLQGYAASREDARKFAASAGLAAQEVAYLPEAAAAPEEEKPFPPEE